MAAWLVLSVSGCLPSSQSQLDEEKETHFLRGKSRVSGMDYKGAIEAYQKALDVNPRSAAAHFELAWLYDQKVPDPAAAIYHYQRFLRLQPASGKAEAARTRILACKQELAKGILPMAPPGVQRDLDQLAAENSRLRDELARWHAYAIRLQISTNPSIANPPGALELQASAAPQPLPNAANSPEIRQQPVVANNRAHVVQAGETPYSISRRYGIKLDAFMAANPGLDPRRMQTGQTVKVPSP